MSNNRFPYGGDDSHLYLFPCKLAPFHWVLAFYFKEYFKLETHFTMLAEVAVLWDSSIGLWRLVCGGLCSLPLGCGIWKCPLLKESLLNGTGISLSWVDSKTTWRVLRFLNDLVYFSFLPVFMFVGQETHQWKKGRWSRGK